MGRLENKTIDILENWCDVDDDAVKDINWWWWNDYDDNDDDNNDDDNNDDNDNDDDNDDAIYAEDHTDEYDIDHL